MRSERKEENARQKAILKAEKTLRKTLRKQGQYDEEIKNVMVKGLIEKYSKMIDDDFIE